MYDICVGVCVMVNIRRLNSKVSVLSYPVRAVRLSGKHLSLLSHLADFTGEV